MMAAMDEVTTVRIKQEEVDDMPNDPHSMFLDDPLGVYWSTDHINEDSKLNFGWDENENNNAVLNTLLHTILEAESECCPPPLLVPKKELFSDDTFGISCPNDFIKEDPELNLEADETENIMPNTSVVDHMETGWIKNDDETNEVCSMYLEDPFLISGSTISVKQDPELNLEPDETETFEVDSKIYSPQGSRFTNVTREANSIPFQETCLLGVTEDKLDIAADTSAQVVGCENPGQVLFSQEDNALHNRNNNDVKENEIHEFTCSSCKQTFLSKYNLITHVFIHIDRVRPPAHICMMCGEVFLTHDSLSNHYLVQAESSGEECQHNTISNKCGNRQCCEVMCADKTQLKCESENKLSTTCNRFRPRRSDIRGDSFRNSGCIKRQTVRHAAEELLECEICGKSFTEPYYFKRHSVTHTGKRPHKCNVCGKSYTVSDSLKRHLLTHSGEKSHKCHICGKAFIASDTLKKHVLIHTGERPHKCDVCGKSFTERSSLKKHNVTHTGERPHKCHICGKSFTQSGSLKKHVVKHIGESIQL